MQKVIVGLGNPGKQYADTRHNIGFKAVEQIAHKYGVAFKNRFQAQIGEVSIGGVKALLVMPQTFMNLSGRSVREVLSWYKLTADNLLVIYDDMDLPCGKIRLRTQGSAGGHNGIKSIISEINTQTFDRVKIGIGRPPEGWDTVNYVLGTFLSEELATLKPTLQEVDQAVTDIITVGMNNAMNKHNR